MGFYLTQKVARRIIETIEAYFNSSTNQTSKYNRSHTIFVQDLESTSAVHNAYNFTFVLKTNEDINYALNLCRIYRLWIEPFETRQKSELGKYSKRFHRFFYIGGLLSSFACGKSSHSTDVTFELTVHYPEADAKYPKQAELYSIGYDYGHLAHFRHVNEFQKSSQKEVSISELILDLNYISCYYKPIFERKSKLKLF